MQLNKVLKSLLIALPVLAVTACSSSMMLRIQVLKLTNQQFQLLIQMV